MSAKDRFNFTRTTTSRATTEWAVWSANEGEYNRATNASAVAAPLVGSFVALVFVISIVCFTSHMRRRRQELMARARSRGNRNAGRSPFVIVHSHSPDWVDEVTSGTHIDRSIHDLPPPYTPPYYATDLKGGDILPPSYADACVYDGYTTSAFNDVTSDDAVSREWNETEDTDDVVESTSTEDRYEEGEPYDTDNVQNDVTDIPVNPIITEESGPRCHTEHYGETTEEFI